MQSGGFAVHMAQMTAQVQCNQRLSLGKHLSLIGRTAADKKKATGESVQPKTKNAVIIQLKTGLLSFLKDQKNSESR